MQNKFIITVCLYIFVILNISTLLNASWIVEEEFNDFCLTPNRQQGFCTDIKQCAPIINILKQYKPIPNDVASYIRQSMCGYDGFTRKVCCPISGQTAGKLTSRQPPNQRPIYNDEPSLLPDTTTCGLGTNNRIYGGQVAEIDDFPWMALLFYKKGYDSGFYCSGVLINHKYVLTASHCVNGLEIKHGNWRLDSVRLGEFDKSSEIDCIRDTITNSQFCAPAPINIKIEEKIPHPDYNPADHAQHNDIALLRLTENVQYTDFIKPICLPISPSISENNFEGYELFVSGWGKTDEHHSYSDKKLKLKVPVVPNSKCAQIYRVKLNLAPSQICAGGERGKDTCNGDSGGPLMALTGEDINWYAIGVVSFGPHDCGTENWPGVYTRVRDYVSWISETIRK